MVVMSGDVGRWCGLFGTLVGVSVLSVMWLESVSEISSPRWSSVYECQSVECAFTSPVIIELGMLVKYCMQFVMSVSVVSMVSCCGVAVFLGAMYMLAMVMSLKCWTAIVVVVIDLPLLRVAVEGSDNPVSLEKPCQASLPPDQQGRHSLGRHPEVQYVA